MENAAAKILQRAVEMDKKEQYTMALVLYQEGLEILVNSIKAPEKNRNFYPNLTITIAHLLIVETLSTILTFLMLLKILCKKI